MDVNCVLGLRKESFYFASGFGTGGFGRLGEGVKGGEREQPDVEEMERGSR